MNEQNKNNIHEEIQYQDIIKNPVRMFGLIYIITLISLVIGGAFYLRYLDFNLDNNKMFRNGLVKEPIEELATKRPTSLNGVDVNLIGKPNDTLVSKGAESFSKNCVSCHGEKGEGNGVAGAALNPKPRNFTSADGWINGRKVSQIFKILEEGIKNSGMSSFSHLPIEERFALIHYVRSLNSTSPEVTDDELSEMDLTYNLSNSRITKALIPVSKAEDILIKEDTRLTKINSIISKLDKDEKGKALNLIICNKEKAMKFLLDNVSWKANSGEFLKSVSSSTPRNGFKTEISKLSKDELNNYYGYLLSLYSN